MKLVLPFGVCTTCEFVVDRVIPRPVVALVSMHPNPSSTMAPWLLALTADGTVATTAMRAIARARRERRVLFIRLTPYIYVNAGCLFFDAPPAV
jgi:hypothetical protein